MTHRSAVPEIWAAATRTVPDSVRIVDVPAVN
jgi:hypothetical protein